MSEILNCPCCGGKALFNTWQREQFDPEEETVYFTKIRCDLCGVGTKKMRNTGENIAILLSSWNARHHPAIVEIDEDDLSEMFSDAVSNGEGEHGPIVKYLSLSLRERAPHGLKIIGEK